MKYSINYLAVGIISLAAALIFFSYFFGMTGVKILIGMIICYGIVTATIFRQLDLLTEERLFLGVFISFGLMPLLIWLVDRILQSIGLSIAGSITLIGVAWIFMVGKHDKVK